MESIVLGILFLFGTVFGSFSSVVIYRLRSGEGGIMGGRSKCPSCKKKIKPKDLVPIFSWLKNKGKCSSCKKAVSMIYPFLEFSMGLLFAGVGYFLIDINLLLSGSTLEFWKLFFWLFVSFITIVYVFYDILFMEINEKIFLQGTGFVLFFLSAQTLVNKYHIIENLPTGQFFDQILLSISSIILAISIVSLLYVIMLKELSEIIDVLILVIMFLLLIGFKYIFNVNITEIAILNGVIGALAIFIFFFFQILISGGKWMGGGDLRIAIFVGLILGTGLTMPALMFTYIFGSIISIIFILASKIINKKSKKKFNSEIPFGPFIALGFFFTIFFQYNILQMIEIYF